MEGETLVFTIQGIENTIEKQLDVPLLLQVEIYMFSFLQHGQEALSIILIDNTILHNSTPQATYALPDFAIAYGNHAGNAPTCYITLHIGS